MNNTKHNTKARSTELARYTWAIALAWTVVVAGLLVGNVYHARDITRETATIEARAHFNKDQAFRLWATSHGGVYVPVDERTPPNAYLSHVPERDIETPSGVRLTLMNPAYMVRQMNEEFAGLYGIAGHITSLKLLRPENTPDDWERAALEAFERGKTEVSEFTEIGGEPYLRLMQPMIAQEGCLKCHGHQGYRVGDVRGGVGVSLPLASLLDRERQTIAGEALSLGLLWLLGLGGVGLGSRRLMQRVQERDRAEKALRESEERFRLAFENANIGMCLLDLDGRLTRVNSQMCEIFGYNQEELESMTMNDFAHPEDLDISPRFIQEAASGEIEHTQFEKRYFHKRGHIVCGQVSSSLVRDFQGAPLYFISHVQDITERVRAEEELRQHREHLEELVKARTAELAKANEQLQREIAERVQAEEALRESEARLHQAQGLARVGHWDWYMDTGELCWSEEVFRIFGQDPESFQPTVESFEATIHPDDLESFIAEREQALGGEQCVSIEHRIVWPDGTLRYVHELAEIVRDDQGDAIRVMGAVQDVTNRKRAEEALRLQRDLALALSSTGNLAEALGRLLETTFQLEGIDCGGVYLVDKVSREANLVAHKGLPLQFVERVSHYKAGSPQARLVATGKPIFQRRSEFPPAIEENLQREGLRSLAVIPVQHEGRVVAALNLASHTHDEIPSRVRNVVEAIAAQIGGVIARIKAEEALREAKDYAEQLIEVANVIIVGLDLTGNIEIFNEAAATITGYTKAELEGKNWFEVLVPKDIYPEVWEELTEVTKGRNIVHTFENSILTKSGQERIISWRNSEVRQGGAVAGTISFGVDITERKRAEEALRELNATLEDQVAERTAKLQQRTAELELALAELQEIQEQLMRSERLAAIGELAASVAHELRNPLSTIRTSAYYLKRKLAGADDRVRGSLEQMEKEILTSDRIIQELLEFARARPPELRSTDLNKVVRAALASTSSPGNVSIVTHLAEELPHMSLDAHQLERAFLNLVTNAVQAMPEGGELSVRTWLDEGAGKQGNKETRKQGDKETRRPADQATKRLFDHPTIVISISDTGEGIPPEDQERIFEPLFTTKVHGTGLGLAICRRIVEAHGGSIEVESKMGEGSVFVVRLPVVSSQ